jgi:poly-gamma-glutamate synthesis protein (capsule biosynthesis protein)
LPEALRLALKMPVDVYPVALEEQAVLRLEVSGERPVSHWIYALVAPFPTIDDGASSEELRRAWGGNRGESPAWPLLVDESTLAVFSALWGAPADGAVQVVPGAELLGYAWDQRPSRAIVPFEALSPRWKVLEVDGLSPLRKGFDPAGYALAVPISLAGDAVTADTMLSVYGPASVAPLLPASNRDPNKLTTLVMTGVTALVRATAFTMEQRGVDYPAKDIGDWLREADITHISNEVPFAKNCPFPNPVQEGMRFCSDPRYIGLLEDVGTDIVELTGDHFADWGAGAMNYTLELYRERGWPYYGGGENLEQGRKAVTLEHNGNRFAFIGCNGKGGGYAQAGKDNPGAVTCAFDSMEAEIARLRSEGYLVIATFQHFEYYTYRAQPEQEADFRRLAQAGALIVSGSQAHQPQAFEFDEGALIHYGLGNLFFDQYDVSEATRQAFIDRHVFYDGRYIGTELLTIMFVDYARPRPMTEDERDELLKATFNASGW